VPNIKTLSFLTHCLHETNSFQFPWELFFFAHTCFPKVLFHSQSFQSKTELHPLLLVLRSLNCYLIKILLNFSSKYLYASSNLICNSSTFLLENSIYCLSRAYSLPASSFCCIVSFYISPNFFLFASSFSKITFFSFSKLIFNYSASIFFRSASSVVLSSLCYSWASNLSFSRASPYRRSIFALNSYLYVLKCSICFSKALFRDDSN